MKVLILSPCPNRLTPALEAYCDEYQVQTGPITAEYCLKERFSFIISYRYRHIIGKEVLDHFSSKAINLHISLLPFCRGAHPVFWAFAEDKPLGVTIHMLDAGLDTGNILIQQVIHHSFYGGESFASLYQVSCETIEYLFELNWKYLRTGECSGWKQQGSPTLHRTSEILDWLPFLPRYWDTPVAEFCKLAGLSHHLLPETLF